MACCSRRKFFFKAGGAVIASSMLGEVLDVLASTAQAVVSPAGPGSRYVPKVMAAFVRRRGEYGMLWPGQIYDGQAALKNYTRRIGAAAGELGLEVDLRPEPIYSLEEADEWVAQAAAAKPDGLLVVVLDRQQHSWPTAVKAAESGIPTVIFSPLGTSFTTNTVGLADKEGVFIASTDDFSRAVYGLKMLKAGARLREMRFIVLEGDERRDTRLDFLGTRLRYVPAKSFLEEYNRTPLTGEIERVAAGYLRQAVRIEGPSERDVLNGVKSFVVARSILEREEGDGITMDCLGAVGPTEVSLPCISWSLMNDCGVPAACEADLGACVAHALVQYLFDRPGFQQDPVADTSKGCLIGSHCCCPTRLSGFDGPAEPFVLAHHHGKRDATPIPFWKAGQRVTVADVLLPQGQRPEMLISAGEVVGNVPVPPSGGCVVAVMVKVDGVDELLDFPGFHQLFFYGDYKRELKQYCRLFGIKATVV
ncbi:MAG: hypothetical protein JXQ83_12155 [Candidatus Glassbacteria bacterium]|nr:hypothetical protein [Candidatus Glassbacteria bacterium]